jgi:hypothetical protein
MVLGTPSRTGPVGGERAIASPRATSSASSNPDSTVRFDFTTVSKVSASISWIGPFPLSAGSTSAERWRMGTQSSRAFFNPCIALVSPGPGTVSVAAMPPPDS